MYGVFAESRTRVKPEDRERLSQSPEGVKLLASCDQWTRNGKYADLNCYTAEAAEAVCAAMNKDRDRPDSAMEQRYVVVIDE